MIVHVHVNNARHYTDHLHLAWKLNCGTGSGFQLPVCFQKILVSIFLTLDFLQHQPTFPKSVEMDKDVINKRMKRVCSVWSAGLVLQKGNFHREAEHPSFCLTSCFVLVLKYGHKA